MTNKTLPNGWHFLGYGSPREFDLSDVSPPAPQAPSPPPPADEHWHYGRLEPWQYCDACDAETVREPMFPVNP